MRPGWKRFWRFVLPLIYLAILFGCAFITGGLTEAESGPYGPIIHVACIAAAVLSAFNFTRIMPACRIEGHQFRYVSIGCGLFAAAATVWVAVRTDSVSRSLLTLMYTAAGSAVGVVIGSFVGIGLGMLTYYLDQVNDTEYARIRR
jgi:hypothetical protein